MTNSYKNRSCDLRVLGIIQARMGSSRLPGKMLMPIIDGKGPLELMIERVKECSLIDKLLIVTTIDSIDDELENLCIRLGIDCFRGAVDDVLDRFYQAVISIPAPPEALVRLTGDCPFFNPRVADLVIGRYLTGDYDYVSNVHPPTFPDGLDVEVFSMEALAVSWCDAQLKYEREHVTQYMCRHPEIFKSFNVCCQEDLSSHRWTLDEKEDFDFVKLVYQHLYGKSKDSFGMHNILNLIETQPEIKEINCQFIRNEGLAISMKNTTK